MKVIGSDITKCRRCPRLVRHCQSIAREKRRAYRDWTYWGKPVPDFGDPKARFLVVGLAPAAHGANRTGRMFTGDRSGEWLYRALYRAGFANQAEATDLSDGLKLKNCLLTAVGHCAPPDNKLEKSEIENCRPWLQSVLDQTPARVYLALGSVAWNTFMSEAKKRGWWEGATPKFGHLAEIELLNGRKLLGSYHPSQQNTFTGRLTEEMFDAVFARVKMLLSF